MDIANAIKVPVASGSSSISSTDTMTDARIRSGENMNSSFLTIFLWFFSACVSIVTVLSRLKVKCDHSATSLSVTCYFHLEGASCCRRGGGDLQVLT